MRAKSCVVWSPRRAWATSCSSAILIRSAGQVWAERGMATAGRMKPQVTGTGMRGLTSMRIGRRTSPLRSSSAAMSAHRPLVTQRASANQRLLDL